MSETIQRRLADIDRVLTGMLPILNANPAWGYTSHTAPAPKVSLAMITSSTNVPSFWKTWIRLFTRSQT